MNQNEKTLRKLIDTWTSHDMDRPNYRSWKKRRLWQENHQHDKVNLILPYIHQKKISILDVGSGMGGLTTALHRKEIPTIGIEFNHDYCRINTLRGKRYGLNNIVINAAGERLPFKANQFDLVVCFDVLEHVRDPQAVLEEIHRVLKPQGICLITIINRYGYYDQHFHLPLVNWLPRKIGDAIVKKITTKKTSHFQDNQTLSEMHYYQYDNFIKKVCQLGFTPIDINEEKINKGNFQASVNTKSIIRILNKIKLTPFLYWIFSRFYTNTFLFVLSKEK